MVRQGVVAGLMGLVSAASALRSLPIPIGELKQAQSANLKARAATYPAYTVSTPVDHFHNESMYEPHSDDKFDLRYWFDAQFYEPGGPVFVLSGGETSGEDRFPYLENGIIYEVTKATKGLGVILEHRYYGDSMPVPNFSTENLRFLTTEQALADTAYFAQNVVFEGLEDVDLSPESTPWIAYGGSYAGSFVAILRILYPDVYYGAISSSGVPQAIWDYYLYWNGAAEFGPTICSETTSKLTNVVDNILLNASNADYVSELKNVFGLGSLTNDADFGSVLSGGVSGLQSFNWDPAVSSDSFFQYCDIVSNDTNQYPDLESKRDTVKELITVGGWADELDPLTDRMLNYIGYLGYASKTTKEEQEELAEYHKTQDDEFLSRTDALASWKAWPYQVCTEWGFLQTGSGYPEDVLPVVSRTIDLEYSSAQCKSAFNITTPANVTRINQYGGFDIAYDRLALIDGEWDPWRAAGAHAVGQEERESTTNQPFYLISGGVHHWDENGVWPNETTADYPPTSVQEAKSIIIDAVTAWVSEWSGTSS